LILFGQVIHVQDRGPIELVRFLGIQQSFFAKYQFQLKKLSLNVLFLPLQPAQASQLLPQTIALTF
jgi:hypothetical protein